MFRRFHVLALAILAVETLWGCSAGTGYAEPPARSGTSPAQRPAAADSGFSFAVYGDSRTMMYLPSKSEQKDEAIKLMVDMFNLVLPEKIAEEVVRKDVKLTYDSKTGELVQIVMPFMTRSEVMTVTVDKGWATEASVEDVKLLPGVRRTIYRMHGGDWVTPARSSKPCRAAAPSSWSTAETSSGGESRGEPCSTARIGNG